MTRDWPEIEVRSYLRTGRKRLVGERRNVGDLHDDESTTDTHVASITGGGEIAIGLGERSTVLCLDGLADRYDRIDCVVDQLHRNSPIELCRALEACLDLVDFVGRELPVLELACEPQLDVAQLDFTHDVAQRRLVGILLGDGERCQDEADAKSTDHGKIFHFCTPFHQRLVRRGVRIDLSLPRWQLDIEMTAVAVVLTPSEAGAELIEDARCSRSSWN